MRWASAVSEEDTLQRGLDECVSTVRREMGEASIDLAVAFVSSQLSPEYGELPGMVRDRLGAGTGQASPMLFGCSAGGVIGGGREVENRAGISLTVAHLPGVEMSPFHVEGDDLPDMDAGPNAWEVALNLSANREPQFLLLVDPFSFPTQDFIAGLDYAFNSGAKVGGMASGGRQRGENALFLGDAVHRSGAVGIAMWGNIAVDTVVAQGCRPIGPLMGITKSQQNLLLELDQRPPVDVLREVFASANERDQKLMEHSLFLGIVIDDIIEEPHQGDFLVRNITGLDAQSGIMAVGEMLQEGQRVQFHVRDALTSTEDLAAELRRYAEEERAVPFQGGLMFSCLGRGQFLYGQPDHDTRMFQDVLGAVPLGGSFCNGEIGPVGSCTFLHAYTSSFGIFRPIQGG